jgi:uncharacterized protein
MKRVILAGGSGFIGRALATDLLAQDCEVIALTRTPRPRSDGVREIVWDGRTVGEWLINLEGAEAVINLAGHTINCVHTPANRRLILESRVNATRAIGDAIRRTTTPPRTLVQASAVGFYGNTGDNVCDDTSPGGSGFLAEICRAWEGALDANSLPRTRGVVLRFGVVLGRDGGALKPLAKLTRWFLGGAAGNGRQFISWIHQNDLNRIVLAAMEREEWHGVFNAVAPNPVTNAEFMRELRRAWHRPWSPPAPAFAVRLLAPLLGAAPSLALEGQRAVPGRLLEQGFQFHFPTLPHALREIHGPVTGSAGSIPHSR